MYKSALRALDAYFSRYPASFPDSDTESRKAFCASIMEEGRLFYEQAHGTHKKVNYYIRPPRTYLIAHCHGRACTGRLLCWRLCTLISR